MTHRDSGGEAAPQPPPSPWNSSGSIRRAARWDGTAHPDKVAFLLHFPLGTGWQSSRRAWGLINNNNNNNNRASSPAHSHHQSMGIPPGLPAPGLENPHARKQPQLSSPPDPKCAPRGHHQLMAARRKPHEILRAGVLSTGSRAGSSQGIWERGWARAGTV